MITSGVTLFKESARVNFPTMKLVFTDGTKNDLKSVIDGLNQFKIFAETIRETKAVVGFITDADQISMQLLKIRNLIIDIFFIEKKVDLSSFPQPSTRNPAELSTRIRLDVLGLRLIKAPLPLLKKTAEIYQLMQESLAQKMRVETKIDDIERSLLGSMGKDGSAISMMEIGSRSGTYISGFGTNKTLQKSLIKEYRTLQKPSDMSDEEYTKLKNLHSKLSDHLNNLAELTNRVATHGIGIELSPQAPAAAPQTPQAAAVDATPRPTKRTGLEKAEDLDSGSDSEVESPDPKRSRSEKETELKTPAPPK